jgi:hypothetical protein
MSSRPLVGAAQLNRGALGSPAVTSTMTRVLLLISIAFVALSVLADPYTFRLNGSDVLLTAPRWQSGAALVDVLLLIAGGVLVLKHETRTALAMLAAELIFALTLNAILIHRDGIDRFIWGFGAERHVLDIAVAFGLRLLVLIALLLGLKRPAAGLPN